VWDADHFDRGVSWFLGDTRGHEERGVVWHGKRESSRHGYGGCGGICVCMLGEKLCGLELEVFWIELGDDGFDIFGG